MNGQIPILKIGNALLVSIQFDLSDEMALDLQENLSQQIVTTAASGVIIDISALEIVDSFVGRMLSMIASISKVLDAETVVVGMRPAVAITLAELGLSLGNVRTALNAEKAFQILRTSYLQQARFDDDDASKAHDSELGSAAIETY